MPVRIVKAGVSSAKRIPAAGVAVAPPAADAGTAAVNLGGSVGGNVGALIGEMMSHVHRRSAGDTLAMLNDAGLTMAQLVALHVLEHGGTRTVSSIAACLRLSPAATSHLVDRLVGQELVGRVEDPSDRRQKRVTIAAAGRRLIDKVQRERTREMSEVVARLSPAVRGQFSQVLVRVIEELSSLPQEKP